MTDPGDHPHGIRALDLLDRHTEAAPAHAEIGRFTRAHRQVAQDAQAESRHVEAFRGAGRQMEEIGPELEASGQVIDLDDPQTTHRRQEPARAALVYPELAGEVADAASARGGGDLLEHGERPSDGMQPFTGLPNWHGVAFYPTALRKPSAGG
ncbi:MAG: hypothetical protein A2082_03900 [Chloroflexi bacterium GWC2_70_10]|nr:MAG: hypothetical protein A2082_03900 [Chloroflexi bacterium GWC2_70_10]